MKSTVILDEKEYRELVERDILHNLAADKYERIQKKLIDTVGRPREQAADLTNEIKALKERNGDLDREAATLRELALGGHTHEELNEAMERLRAVAIESGRGA